jgi:hypothetical protein
MAPEKSWRMLQLVCSGFCEQTSGFFRCLGYNFGICSKFSSKSKDEHTKHDNFKLIANIVKGMG